MVAIFEALGMQLGFLLVCIVFVSWHKASPRNAACNASGVVSVVFCYYCWFIVLAGSRGRTSDFLHPGLEKPTWLSKCVKNHCL